MAVGKIIPKFDGEFSEDVNVHAPTGGIIFHKIGKSGWKRRNVAEAFEQFALFTRLQRAEKIENINGNEQPRVAHLIEAQFALALFGSQPAVGGFVVNFSRQFLRIINPAPVLEHNHERHELAPLLG